MRSRYNAWVQQAGGTASLEGWRKRRSISKEIRNDPPVTRRRTTCLVALAELKTQAVLFVSREPSPVSSLEIE